jgi:23S rRNA (uracil1939-C5)-methyltransferase
LGIKNVPRKGRVLVGFRERSAPFIADLRECHILAEPVGRLIEPLGRMVEGLSILNRLPQAEVAVAENAVVFVLRVLDPPTAADLERMREFELAHDVRLYLQSGGPDTIQPLTPGAAPLHYRIAAADVTIEFQPTDFLQVNGALNEAMVAQALAMLDAQPADRVLDLFCGLGNFSLPIARGVATVVAVEGDAGLVERARANANAWIK